MTAKEAVSPKSQALELRNPDSTSITPKSGQNIFIGKIKTHGQRTQFAGLSSAKAATHEEVQPSGPGLSLDKHLDSKDGDPKLQSECVFREDVSKHLQRFEGRPEQQVELQPATEQGGSFSVS